MNDDSEKLLVKILTDLQSVSLETNIVLESIIKILIDKNLVTKEELQSMYSKVTNKVSNEINSMADTIISDTFTGTPDTSISNETIKSTDYREPIFKTVKGEA